MQPATTEDAAARSKQILECRGLLACLPGVWDCRSSPTPAAREHYALVRVWCETCWNTSARPYSPMEIVPYACPIPTSPLALLSIVHELSLSLRTARPGLSLNSNLKNFKQKSLPTSSALLAPTLNPILGTEKNRNSKKKTIRPRAVHVRSVSGHRHRTKLYPTWRAWPRVVGFLLKGT